MHAAANGHFSTVRALLKRGADVRSVGSQVWFVLAFCLVGWCLPVALAYTIAY